MSDFDKIELYGKTYNVKDSDARTSIATIDEAISDIESNIEVVKADVPVIEYDESKTQIKVTKGV